MSNQRRRPHKWVRQNFDREGLRRVCEMHENKFARTYDMEVTRVAQRAPDDFYLFKDNGSDILAVAHLDTVVDHKQRTCRFIDTNAGPVVHSGALDDRLGAHILLNVLPRLGIRHDWLFTTGEEMGASTAMFFEPRKDYKWMIEFDRGGTDVVAYDYEDNDLVDRIEDSGARFSSMCAFTDICFLEHLGIKGINWGVGYQDYHSVRGHAYLEDTYMMLASYLRFHEANADVYLPHVPKLSAWGRGGWWDDACRECGMWSEECECESAAHGEDEYAATLAEYSAQVEREWEEWRERNLAKLYPTPAEAADASSHGVKVEQVEDEGGAA